MRGFVTSRASHLENTGSLTLQLFQTLTRFIIQYRRITFVSTTPKLKILIFLFLVEDVLATQLVGCFPGYIHLTPFIFEEMSARSPGLNSHHLSVIPSNTHSVS